MLSRPACTLALAIAAGCTSSGDLGARSASPRAPAAQEPELAVAARALFVLGTLPPLRAGGPECAQGLLIGLPGGLSFEYRADDLRLRAVRRGAFVAGASEEALAGSALHPRGRLVEVLDGGDPAPWVYACASGRDWPGMPQALSRSPGAENPFPLDVRLSGTWSTSDGGAHLDATLPRNLQRVERMSEELRAVALDGAEGYQRSVSFGPVHLLGNDPEVFAVLASWPPDTTFARGAPSLARETPPFSDEQSPFLRGEPPCLVAALSGAWVVVAVDEGFEARWFDPPAAMGWKTLDGRLCVVANAFGWNVKVVVLRLAAWNDALLERYAQALARK